MKMNKLALACGVAILGMSSVAQAELSATITAASNYLFRGVTASGDDAVVQGSVDYAHESGIYAGTWVSTLGGGNSGEEYDLYIGYGGEVNEVGYDINVTRIGYTQCSDCDYYELIGSLSYKWFTAGFAWTFESDVDEVAGQADPFIEDDVYYYLTGEYEFMPTWTASATIGHFDFDDDGDAGQDLDYDHFALYVTKSAGDFGDFSLGYEYTDTNDTWNSRDTVVASWSKTF